MKLAGLDFGEKRIGIAMSDPLGRIAFPFDTLVRRGGKHDIHALQELFAKEGVQMLVVGLPRQMDGTLGKSADGVAAFVRNLQESLEIPIRTWDERLTTQESIRRLLEADVSRRKRKEVVDKVAACLILQGFLDWAATHDLEVDGSPEPFPAPPGRE